MADNTKIDIDNLVLDMFRIRFTNEYKYLLNENNNKIDDEKEDEKNKCNERQLRINMLARILNSTTPIIYSNNIITTREYSPSNTDKYIYQQEWKYLKHQQRLSKIKEYIEEQFKFVPLQEHLFKLFLNLPEGKICSKHIIYNPKLQKIQYVSCIKFNKNSEVVIV